MSKKLFYISVIILISDLLAVIAFSLLIIFDSGARIEWILGLVSTILEFPLSIRLLKRTKPASDNSGEENV